jgi:hypothetical protein
LADPRLAALVRLLRIGERSRDQAAAYREDITMNTTKTDITIHITLNETGDPPSKVADAQLHFDGGPLTGLELIGFAVWQSRIGGARSVTFPARQYRVNGELRAFALLRPIDDDQTAHEIRALILAACQAAETAASSTTAEQLVRQTLQPTHQLTEEQAIELTEDITVVMGAELLNARGAWRLIVARLGGIHNLPAHLPILTSRHRAKLA